MGEQKLRRTLWQKIKAGFVVMTFPALVMAGVYSLFVKFPGSYASEARIRVKNMTDPATDQESRDYALKLRIGELVENMNSTKLLTLLSFKLAIHDLSEEPFQPILGLKQAYPEEMISYGLKAFQEKREKIDLNLSGASIDTMLAHILQILHYEPEQLKNDISVRRIPGSDVISIQARTDHSEMTTFMVNEYAQEFIRYHEIVGKERIQESIAFLEHLLDQKKNDLEEKTDRLNTQREIIRNQHSESELEDIQIKIEKLEASRKQEEEKIKALKASLLEQQKKEQSKAAVRTSNIVQAHDDRDLMVELGSALARKQFLEQQIEQLKNKILLKEETILTPLKEENDKARQAYLEVLGKLKVSRDYAENIEGSITQITWGKSRFPYEGAPIILALLAGIAAAFVWYAFLLNLGYL